jgi:glycosyltransferase involved in cell wall biosynthesis
MSVRVLYHIPTPRPRRPECDAVHQEIEALERRFHADTVYLHPSEYTRWPLPRLLFGLRQLRGLRRRESEIDVHHIYNPDPYPFPYLRFLRKPIVYTLSAGLRPAQRVPAAFFSSVIARTVVADETNLRLLSARGIRRGRTAPTGIDVSRFEFQPIELNETLVLLAGSAPWSRDQFAAKGVDALLSAAARCFALHLMFLWRGHLLEDMQARVRERAPAAHVEVIDEVIDVNRVLARAHAAVVLATDAAVVKAYPHSLLEALAAGRPVVISRGIPLADWVEREQCGVVVDRVEPDAILSALERLRAEYRRWQANARRAGRDAFPIGAMLQAYAEIYGEIIAKEPGHG